MRTRGKIIESSGAVFEEINIDNMIRMQSKDDAILEVLLDIRDLLADSVVVVEKEANPPHHE